MKTFYIQGSHWYEGWQVEINHEGRRYSGVLVDADDDKHLACLRDADGKLHWAHQSFFRLKPIEPKRSSRNWNF